MTAKICLTHSGPFHSDDVLAAVILKLAGQVEKYSDIVRTRDQEKMKTADIVFDVGGDYDPKTHRYDHHQRGRSGQFWEDETPMSSAGLVWQSFVDKICPDSIERRSLEGSWIRPVDADDNGWLEPLPRNARHISAIVSDLNPRWDDENADFDAEYVVACEVIEKLFLASWNRAKGKRAARVLVQEAIAKCPNQDLLILDQYCPWKSHLHSLEEELEVTVPYKFVLFPGDNDWKIFQVPVSKGSHDGRASFAESWGGLREDELREISGIGDAKFVHPGLFCGGAETLEGAKAMAMAGVAIGNEATSSDK